MPGPIDSLRYAHTALDREVTDLLEAVSALGSTAAAAALADRIEFLLSFGAGHTRAEEAGLFPDLDRVVPGIAAEYLADHQAERDAADRIRSALRGCAAGDAEALGALQREFAALAEHTRAHTQRENEQVLPAVHQHFSVPEQLGMVGRIAGSFTPAEMGAMLPFIVARIDPPDRVAYLSNIARSAPPPVMVALGRGIQARLAPAEWESLVAAVPALA
jgi:hemerythrin-like domain-containing protein